MNCDEFKNKVADLFDTTIDMQTKAECNQQNVELITRNCQRLSRLCNPNQQPQNKKLLSSAISFGVLL